MSISKIKAEINTYSEGSISDILQTYYKLYSTMPLSIVGVYLAPVNSRTSWWKLWR
jgi:hypothetical protein